eukprot:scaffold7955_cov47-Attheya_sp.AAC.3
MKHTHSPGIDALVASLTSIIMLCSSCVLPQNGTVDDLTCARAACLWDFRWNHISEFYVHRHSKHRSRIVDSRRCFFAIATIKRIFKYFVELVFPM